MSEDRSQESSSAGGKAFKRSWPRSGRTCAYSKEPLTGKAFYYSALVEKQEQWVRYDLAPEYFQTWKQAQELPLVAWWKVVLQVKDKPAHTFSERALEAMEHLVEEKELVQSMAFEERVLLMALTLQRKKLAQVDFLPKGGCRVTIDRLDLGLDLKFVGASYLTSKGVSIRKRLEQLQTALEQ